jgi:hypothetical protein
MAIINVAAAAAAAHTVFLLAVVVAANFATDSRVRKSFRTSRWGRFLCTSLRYFTANESRRKSIKF